MHHKEDRLISCSVRTEISLGKDNNISGNFTGWLSAKMSSPGCQRATMKEGHKPGCLEEVL